MRNDLPVTGLVKLKIYRIVALIVLNIFTKVFHFVFPERRGANWAGSAAGNELCAVQSPHIMRCGKVAACRTGLAAPLRPAV